MVPVFKETSSLPLLDRLLALELRGGAGVQRDIKPTSLRPSPGTGAAAEDEDGASTVTARAHHCPVNSSDRRLATLPPPLVHLHQLLLVMSLLTLHLLKAVLPFLL